MTSILTSIKKLLGIAEEYTHFDSDIVMYINTALSMATQIGIGPTSGFSISDATATWDQFIGASTTLEMVKSYVHLKVKLIFDPPASSAVIESVNNLLTELEWRMQVAAEAPAEEV